MPYKIELRYAYGWDDAEWTEDLDDGRGPRALRFRRADDAQAALEEHLAEVDTAVREGSFDIPERRDNYRIVEAID